MLITSIPAARSLEMGEVPLVSLVFVTRDTPPVLAGGNQTFVVYDASWKWVWMQVNQIQAQCNMQSTYVYIYIYIKIAPSHPERDCAFYYPKLKEG